MDYKEKYEQALERARDNYNVADSADINVNSFRSALIYIFPELAESEDERMMQFLWDLASGNGQGIRKFLSGYQKENFFAWFKKKNEENETFSKSLQFTPKQWEALDFSLGLLMA